MTETELRERFGRNAREEIQKFSIQKIGEQFETFILKSN